MRRQSAKAAALVDARAAVRWRLLAERGAQCEGCPVTPVGNRRDPRLWSDLHEVLTRARGGSITDPANILCLCRECHRWVTEHEEEARALGLVRARSAEEHRATFRPWEAPVESVS